MKTLKSITDKYETLYKASKALNIHQQQLTRWLDNNALIDEAGAVFIKTKGVIAGAVDFKKQGASKGSK